MAQIEQKYEIDAPVEKVWDAFFNIDTIDNWGGGPAHVQELEGSNFSLWGGEVHDITTKLKKFKLIEQDWYSGNKWPKPSKVIFTFIEKDGKTTVYLTHDNIPDDEIEDIKIGWEKYYLGPIRDLFNS